eukprot:11160984-Lingulodinium_polyedra.AAC.1
MSYMLCRTWNSAVTCDQSARRPAAGSTAEQLEERQGAAASLVQEAQWDDVDELEELVSEWLHRAAG